MPKKSPTPEGAGTAPARRGWSLRGSSLRFKMAIAVAIPMVVAAVLGAIQVRQDLDEAVSHERNASQVSILGPAIDYMHAVEQATVAAQRDTRASKARLARHVESLTTAADELAEASSSAQLTGDQLRQVGTILDLSKALREQTKSLSADTWVAQARQLNSGVNHLISTLDEAQWQPEPRLELLAQALSGRFSLSMQEALATNDREGRTGNLELFAELGVETAAIDRLNRSLGDSEPAVLVLRTDNSERFRAARTGRGKKLEDTAFRPYDKVITDLQNSVRADLRTAADESMSAAVFNGGTTVAAFLAAVLLALLISYLLLDPIRKVREGATAVANEYLPEAVASIRAGNGPGEFHPIDVTTTEEMGQMARAVDDLHRQAIRLASGEAEARAQVNDMFVTLSRRNTTLVNQQLALIETLEKDEEDPRRLDSLFRLDHLASRMRRTADSLLILGDAPSRPGDLASLSVTEALHAATSGVLDYQRVRVDATAGQQVVPAVGADLVHLLTELVDNALAFSPPSTNVELTAHERPGGVDLEVIDAGLGIAPAEMVAINESLSAGGDITSDTARRMGLFVVSRLAQRHGITVRLSRNGRGGTTAHVHLSNELLTAPKAPVAMAVAETAPAAPVPSPVTPAAPAAPAVRTTVPTADEPAAPLPTRSTPAATTTTPAAAGANGLPQRRPGAAAAAGGPGAPAAPGAPGGPAGQGLLGALQDTAPAAAKAPATTATPVVTDTTATPTVQESAPVKDSAAAKDSAPANDSAAAKDGAAVKDSVPGTPGTEPAALRRPRRRVRYTETIGLTGSLASDTRVPLDASRAVIGSSRGRGPGGQLSRQAAASLDGPLTGTEASRGETPMFKDLRSSWFDRVKESGGDRPWGSSEVEQGWNLAGEVAGGTVEEQPRVTGAGLPVRRPGQRLVPGSVTQPTATPAIDPEKVRARLAAHSAGVSRGRHAASNTNDSTDTERTDQEAGTS